MNNGATQHLPDISGLEHVEVNTGSSGWCMIGCLPVIAAVIWWAITGRAVISVSIIAVSIVAMFLITYLSDTVFTTTPDGLTAKRSLRTKSISWTDVIEACNVPGKHELPSILIKSDTTTISIPVMGEETLEASIWQHLRRYGKADILALSDDALSIWADIPDDIPEELDYLDDVPDELGKPVKYQLRNEYISEEYMEVSADDLDSTKRTENPMAIRWSDVTCIQWNAVYDDYIYLIIKASDGRKIYIRDWGSYDNKYTDVENARFLLAVIRRARKTDIEPAIPIPEGIRKLCGVKLPV